MTGILEEVLSDRSSSSQDPAIVDKYQNVADFFEEKPKNFLVSQSLKRGRRAGLLLLVLFSFLYIVCRDAVTVCQERFVQMSLWSI
jgi:hypothetical protein